MAFRTSCPHCGRSYSFSDETLDKKVRCKQCEKVFAAEAADAKVARPSGESKQQLRRDDDEEPPTRRRKEDDPDDRRSKKHRPGPQKSLLPWLIGGGAIVAVGVVVLVIVLSNSSSDGGNGSKGDDRSAKDRQEPPDDKPQVLKVPLRPAHTVNADHYGTYQLDFHSRGDRLVVRSTQPKGTEHQYQVIDRKTLERRAWQIPRLFAKAWDLSDDGTLLALASGGRGPDAAIDILSVPDLKPVVNGWDPYPGNNSSGLAFVSLLPQKRIVTVLANGRLDIWNYADRQHKTGREESKRTVIVGGRNVVVSPDRKVMALVATDTIDLINLETGKPFGSAESLGGAWITLPDPPCLTFSSDGKTLVGYGLVNDAAGASLYLGRWEVATGRTISKVRVARPAWDSSDGISLWGPNHVLVRKPPGDRAFLYDLTTGALCRDCQFVSGRFGTIGEDGLLWYTSNKYMNAVRFPSVDLTDFPTPAPVPEGSAPPVLRIWYFNPEGISENKV